MVALDCSHRGGSPGCSAEVAVPSARLRVPALERLSSEGLPPALPAVSSPGPISTLVFPSSQWFLEMLGVSRPAFSCGYLSLRAPLLAWPLLSRQQTSLLWQGSPSCVPFGKMSAFCHGEYGHASHPVGAVRQCSWAAVEAQAYSFHKGPSTTTVIWKHSKHLTQSVDGH